MLTSPGEQIAAPFPLTETDRQQLALDNADFEPHTWDELKRIIAENRLEVFKRWPSELRRYARWSTETKAVYGTVPNYIMQERLHWQPLPSSTTETGPIFELANSTPFADPRDYKILPNDWPYGLAPGISHIIVWLKHRLECESSGGDMTSRSRAQAQEFVQRTFVDRIRDLPGERDRVQWFKNWTALQSIPGLEHLHVLVRDVPEDIILEWTGGERVVQGDE